MLTTTYIPTHKSKKSIKTINYPRKTTRQCERNLALQLWKKVMSCKSWGLITYF